MPLVGDGHPGDGQGKAATTAIYTPTKKEVGLEIDLRQTGGMRRTQPTTRAECRSRSTPRSKG